MKHTLDFNIPFTQFGFMGFINCFTSTKMYLEKIENRKTDSCQKGDGGKCVHCGGCWDVQTEYFLLYHTMCGGSSVRRSYDGNPTEMEKLTDESEDTIDFLFGFAGYECRKCADSAMFKAEIKAMIDADKPVIAKLNRKDEKNATFCVINGYDDDALTIPDNEKEWQQPKNVPAYDDLQQLYLFGDKITPRHSLKDGLERMRMVMEYNINEKLWDAYAQKMHPEVMVELTPEERKERMNRLYESRIAVWFCHNTAEAFRYCYHEELRSPALCEIRKRMDELNSRLLDLGFAIQFLNDVVDWAATTHRATVAGISEMICSTIVSIKMVDKELLSVVTRAIEIVRREAESA